MNRRSGVCRVCYPTYYIKFNCAFATRCDCDCDAYDCGKNCKCDCDCYDDFFFTEHFHYFFLSLLCLNYNMGMGVLSRGFLKKVLFFF